MDITISNTRKYNNNVFSSTVFQLKGISEWPSVFHLSAFNVIETRNIVVAALFA